MEGAHGRDTEVCVRLFGHSTIHVRQVSRHHLLLLLRLNFIHKAYSHSPNPTIQWRLKPSPRRMNDAGLLRVILVCVWRNCSEEIEYLVSEESGKNVSQGWKVVLSKVIDG